MKQAIPLFAIAIILLSAAVMRLPDSVRNVDIVSLLATGVLVGVLVTVGIGRLRS